jgi:hypothetical protein
MNFSLNRLFIFGCLCTLFVFLSCGTSNAKFVQNLEWFDKENLIKPIILTINNNKYDLDKDIDKIVDYLNNLPLDFYFLPERNRIGEDKKKCASNLQKNIYLLRPKIDELVELPADLTWSEDPFKDRNWQFWFHSWEFTDCLLAGYTAFEDKWYINRLKWLVFDWWNDNFTPDFPSKEFSWYDQTIPKRLHQMLRIFEFIRRNKALDNDFTRVALRAIYWHARILAEEEALYVKNHNHGLDQSFRLFEVSQIFQEYTQADSWEEVARKRLVGEIDFALTSEGVHKENSPEYHGWVSAYIAQINDFAEHYTGEAIKPSSKHLQEGGLKFITAITRPDGTYPPLGDTKHGIQIKASYPNLEQLGWYPHYQYLLTKGKLGSKPLESTLIFPESGYFIYRDKWDEPGQNTATQLIFKCDYLAKGHRHNDDGNILLYAMGEDWLIDAGMYGYKNDKYRQYITSPSAHNISFPYSAKDSSPYDRKTIKTLENRLDNYKENWGLIETDKTHAICSSNMFVGFQYRRILEIIGKKSFKLTDTLFPENSDDKNNYKFTTIFRIPDDKTFYIDSRNNIIIVLNSSKNVGLEIKYGGKIEYAKLIRGEEDELLSLESNSWLNMSPVKTIVFISQSKKYAVDFIISLISNPNLQDFERMTLKEVYYVN